MIFYRPVSDSQPRSAPSDPLRQRESLRLKEPASAITHFVGFIAACTCLPFLIGKAVSSGAGIPALIGCLMFLLSMICLYGASSAYHALDISPAVNLTLKKCDHLSIFLLIAGSYTPVCLTALTGSTGIALLMVVWGCTGLGMLIKFFWVTCPRWVSSLLYLMLGWSCVFILPQLYRALSAEAFGYLLSGGLLYSLGGIVYALKCPIFNRRHPRFGTHEIFHVLVMLGSLCHFLLVYRCLLA